MATQLIKTKFDTLTSIGTITNLNSLPDANWWQSDVIADSDPAFESVEIWWTLVFNATPVAGDFLWFKLAFGNGDGTEIFDGGMGTGEGKTSTAATIAAIEQAPMPQWTHYWVANHGTTFKGHRAVPLLAPRWCLGIKASGEALASSGNVLKYRYRTPRIEAAV